MSLTIHFDNPAHVAVLLVLFLIWTFTVAFAEDSGNDGIYGVPCVLAIIGLLTCFGMLIWGSI